MLEGIAAGLPHGDARIAALKTAALAQPRGGTAGGHRRALRGRSLARYVRPLRHERFRSTGRLPLISDASSTAGGGVEFAHDYSAVLALG
jgi:hypothetical protein